METREIPWLNNGTLVEGRIPAHTACPYNSDCWFAKTKKCQHRGEKHQTTFRCFSARILAVLDRFLERSEGIPIEVCLVNKGEEEQ